MHAYLFDSFFTVGVRTHQARVKKLALELLPVRFRGPDERVGRYLASKTKSM